MTSTIVPDPGPAAPAYEQALRCPCGQEMSGGTESVLVTEVRAHLHSKHPHLADRYDDDDILALAHSRPS